MKTTMTKKQARQMLDMYEEATPIEDVISMLSWLEARAP